MKASELVAGLVVQVDPGLEDCFFNGCFMTVTEVKSWGAQGYVMMPRTRDLDPAKIPAVITKSFAEGSDMIDLTSGGGQAYFRVEAKDCEPVGVAVWVHELLPGFE